MKHYNDLTPAQAERLAYLAEECGEVIQIVGKILRHGYSNFDPTASPPRATNRNLLRNELIDLMGAINLMEQNNDFIRIIKDKPKSTSKYFHHQDSNKSEKF